MSRLWTPLLAVVVLLAAAALIAGALGAFRPGSAPEHGWTISQLSTELMCPTCKTRLDQSDSPQANQIRRELGLTQHWAIVIVGIGNLGHALANYKGFAERGFRVAALVDADPSKVGEMVGGIAVRRVEDLPELVAAEQIAIGVIATPAAVVQEVADLMVAAGIRSILNFAPAVIAVPAGVSVRKVDLAIELQILAFYEQRKATLAEVKRRGRAVADLTRP